MSKCKVTVLRRMFNEDLAEEYCSHPEKCSMFKDGETFLLNSTLKPPGFCDGAWSGIFIYVFAFIHGGNAFFNNWMKDENTMIACCSDGIRPVVFKLERVD
ncbi:MAG: TIGR04076 family protein [Clostridia bacterium]|nr:TIGR04076 family protein [Clostridia bacterium]